MTTAILQIDKFG